MARRHIAAGAVLAAGACAAVAQRDLGIEARNAVLSRARLAYDPAGFELGPFRATPAIAARLAYDSNVFNTPRARGDASAQLRPGLSIASQWRRHALQLDADATIDRYVRQPRGDSDQADVRLTGRIDIGAKSSLTLAARAAELIEPRGTIGDLFGDGRPIRYALHEGTATASGVLPGLSLRVQGRLADLAYHTVTLDGARVSQAYRDRREASGDAALDLAIGPQIALAGILRANRVRYDQPASAGTLDSRGLAALAGLSFRATGLIYGRAAIGWLEQRFDLASAAHVTGLTYDLSLVWNATPLTSITLIGNRAVQQSPFPDAPAILQGNVAAIVDHELTRDLLVRLNAGYTLDDYRSLGRTDRRWSGGVSMHYLMGHGLSLDVGVDGRRQRSSIPAGRRYAGAAASIGLSVRR